MVVGLWGCGVVGFWSCEFSRSARTRANSTLSSACSPWAKTASPKRCALDASRCTVCLLWVHVDQSFGSELRPQKGVRFTLCASLYVFGGAGVDQVLGGLWVLKWLGVLEARLLVWVWLWVCGSPRFTSLHLIPTLSSGCTGPMWKITADSCRPMRCLHWSARFLFDLHGSSQQGLA